MTPKFTHRRILVVDKSEQALARFTDVFQSFNSSCEESAGESGICGVASFPPPADSLQPCDQPFAVTCSSRHEEAITAVYESIVAVRPMEVVFLDIDPTPDFDAVEMITSLWRLDPDLQIVAYADPRTCPWDKIVARLGVNDRLFIQYQPMERDEIIQFAIALSEKRRTQIGARKQLRILESSNLDLQAELGQSRYSENQLAHAATHDGLTGLPNRESIRDIIAESVSESSTDSCTALMFLDIDNFKSINDSLGHCVGDVLLIEFAKRLRNIEKYRDGEKASQSTFVARLGGDEFVLLLKGLETNQDAERIALTLQQHLTENYALDGHDLNIGVSIGITFLGEGVTAPEDLMRNADLAMYRAKFGGKQCVAIFDDAMHKAAARRLHLESSLRSALRQNEFSMRHQPIFRLCDQELVSIESLLRWTLSDGSEVSPDEFIPLAEETGLIVPIGNWVLQQACQTISQINANATGDQRISLSINVAKRQLQEPNFVEVLAESLERFQIDGSDLNLEITESCVVDGPESILATLQAIRALGVKIFLDDFGTGRSSLSCLHGFPIDVVKVDRSIVSTMESNPHFESIVAAVIALAHSFGTTVIAEGIEVEQQRDRLIDLGCDWGQGYLFSKPLLCSELLNVVTERPSMAVPAAIPLLAPPLSSPGVSASTRIS